MADQEAVLVSNSILKKEIKNLTNQPLIKLKSLNQKIEQQLTKSHFQKDWGKRLGKIVYRKERGQNDRRT